MSHFILPCLKSNVQGDNPCEVHMQSDPYCIKFRGAGFHIGQNNNFAGNVCEDTR